MLHSLLVLHYTDVVASVAVQKAPKEGDYRVSKVQEYYMVKEWSSQKNGQICGKQAALGHEFGFRFPNL